MSVGRWNFSPASHGRRYHLIARVAVHHFSTQSTCTLIVTPLVTVTGPGAWHTEAPAFVLRTLTETMYVPTDTGTENRPVAPTAMIAIYHPTVERDLSLQGSRAGAEVPPTAWRVPVRVPVGPGTLSGIHRWWQRRNNTERKKPARPGTLDGLSFRRVQVQAVLATGSGHRLRSGKVEAMIVSEAQSPPMTVAQYQIPGARNAICTWECRKRAAESRPTTIETRRRGRAAALTPRDDTMQVGGGTGEPEQAEGSGRLAQSGDDVHGELQAAM